VSVSSGVFPSHSSASSSTTDAEYFWAYVETSSRRIRQGTYINFTDEACNVHNVVLQERVQSNIVRLFAEEDIVRKILDDFCDDHEPPSNDDFLLFWYFHVDRFRGNDSRRYKSTSP
jgi:hypothetical protein